MKLLVIEDDEKTVAYLRKGLSAHGFVVDISRDGEDGLRRATKSAYDLVILDVVMPARDGWSVLAELRRAGNQSPVLYLSGLGTLADRVRGLRLGADDYLTKPFGFSELLARVESILRRARPPDRQRDPVRVADLEIDLFRHRASRQGRTLDLTPKEFQLLSLLARQAGELLPRATIADQIWGMGSDDVTNAVEAHIRRLRCKVDEPFEKRLIHTVRGLGYVLEER